MLIRDEKRTSSPSRGTSGRSSARSSPRGILILRPTRGIRIHLTRGGTRRGTPSMPSIRGRSGSRAGRRSGDWSSPGRVRPPRLRLPACGRPDRRGGRPSRLVRRRRRRAGSDGLAPPNAPVRPGERFRGVEALVREGVPRAPGGAGKGPRGGGRDRRGWRRAADDIHIRYRLPFSLL